ncbi:MAG TPA: ABC transporter ATP-binding protein [Desulfuromonadales bacterium]|nr:ABC transporter ATP-binding protein [Desulfuromonadales bacterium]
MTDSTPLLEVRDLIVARGGVEVVRVPSFSLKEHETMALIGPNGSGKSSFMLSLACLLRPTSGEIIFRGEPLNYDGGETAFRRKIAMVFQEPLLFDTTVYENVAAGLKIRRVPVQEIRTRVDTCMERFKIPHLAERSARKLSGGEAQRTSLARAFATDPEVILLDEPFAALDPPTRQALIEDLERVLRESGTTAIITTHDQTEALRLADRMAVMQNGTIVQAGIPSNVMGEPVNEFVASFVGMENIFTGTVSEVTSGLLSLTIGTQKMEISGKGSLGESVTFCIHPEHVLITSSDPDRQTSARNVFSGTVVKIVPFGLYNKVYLDCGFVLVAAVTNQSLEELRLQTGSMVYALMKATAVHQFRKG